MLPSLRRRWTARRSMSTAPPASPMAGNSGWGARWAFPPRSSTPVAPWGWKSCAATSTSFTAAARSAEPFKCESYFPFFSYRPLWKDSGLYFCFAGMDCFCSRNTFAPEFRKIFFRSYHDVFFISPFCTKTKSYFLAEIRAKNSHFPLDNPYFAAVKLYWKVWESVQRGVLKCARKLFFPQRNPFQTAARMTTLVQRRGRL